MEHTRLMADRMMEVGDTREPGMTPVSGSGN